MAECWDQNREKVCRQCDSNFYKKVNTCCEQSFYRIGVVTAIYAPAILVFFIVFFGGLGLGIFQAQPQNDLYVLWIEKGSRLLGERNYTFEHHSGGIVRKEIQMFSNPALSSKTTAPTRNSLPSIYDTFPASLNVTVEDPELGTTVGYHELCDRLPTPLAMAGIMRFAGARGFPCTKFGVIDCFKEGEFGTFGFDLPDAVLQFTSTSDNYRGCCTGPIAPMGPPIPMAKAIIAPNMNTCGRYCVGTKLCVAAQLTGNMCQMYTAIPTYAWSQNLVGNSSNCSLVNATANIFPICIRKNARFSNKYLFQKSYKNMTDAEILDVMSTPKACAGWVGVQPPDTTLFGGLQRDPVTKHATVIPSVENIAFIKSFAQYAKSKCVDKCVKAAGCDTAIKTALYTATQAPGTLPAVTAAFFPCLVKSLLNDTFIQEKLKTPWGTTTQAQVTAACGCFLPPANCISHPNPLCGQCTIANGNFSNPMCQNCALFCSQYVPPVNATLEACIGDTVSGVVGAALGAAAVCEGTCRRNCSAPSEEALATAEAVITEWESKYISYMTNTSTNKSVPFVVDFFSDRSISDLVNSAGAADGILIVVGYFVMIAFGCATLSNFDCLQSRLMLGFLGMILVILSIVASLGFTAIVRIPFVPTIVQVLPFLSLGLGTYDMFVMAFAFNYIPEKTIPAMLGELMKECGPRLLLTATTNIIVFGIGANIPLPAVNCLSGAMCIVILFNFLILVFGFGALIALHAERIRRNKVDCLCCFNAKYKSQAISTDKVNQIGRIPTAFAKFMFAKPTQLFILAASIVILGVAIWGASRVQIGLPINDIVPRDTYAYGFLKQRNRFYLAGSSSIVTGYRAGKSVQIDYTDPIFYRDILALEAKLQTLNGTDSSLPIAQTSWVDGFLFFCATNPGCANVSKPTDPVVYVTGINPLTNAPITFDSSTTPIFPIKATFPLYLNNYLSSSGLNNVQYIETDPQGNIISSRIPYYQIGLANDQMIVDYIVATRKLTDACPQIVYPQGDYYDLYEQYVKTREYLGTNLGYTCIGVLIISSFFLFHPGAVLIMFALICLTVGEIYGFLSFFNLKLNGVSVVNMIMAIGVIVAPVAHITRVFMVAQGTNMQRAEHALAMMMFPMLFSTVSTFVGEFPMEFARFPYFRLYFFYQYVIIGVITLINAFLPLPLLLAYLGPPPLSEEAPEKAQYVKGGLVEIPGLEDSTAPSGRTTNEV